MEERSGGLATIFQSREYRISYVVDSNEKIKWMPILLCWSPDKYLGIAENGCWVVEECSGIRSLDMPSDYLRIKVLLERSLADIKSEINKVLTIYRITELNFPYGSIISQVIASDSDYWVERAFGWYDKMSNEEKETLAQALEKAQNRSGLSQKLRHKAKKELIILRSK